MEKTINVGGKELKLKSTAGTLRIYRIKFKRDLMGDIAKLTKGMNKKGEVNFSVLDLELFENIAYVMAWQADKSIPASIDEWLDGFDTFSIYEILPEILELWNMNNLTLERSKKNLNQVTGK